VSISRRIANLESVDGVLAAIVDLSRRLVNADAAALGLWDYHGEKLELKCYATPQETKTVDGLPIKTALIHNAVRSCSARRYPEDAGHDEGWVCPILRQQVRAAAIAPLQLEGRPIGGLWVTRCTAWPFTPTDLAGLEHLADQAVIALEHALLTANLQSLAVVEERSRIAREMHDGLAQILGYLSLEMQTLAFLVGQDNREQALAELHQARSRINAAQADVRESILSLRTTLAGDVGLIPALQQYVEEFGVQTGIEMTLVAEVEQPRLSPLAETQLVRVVQEALANVRKHAHAQRVEVRLATRGDCLTVSVQDDGVGMNGRGSPDAGHFGIQTMRERAESVGGGLSITSRPGAGTQVELWLPLAQH
jgi:signal transduction histidine kinase